MTKKTPETLAAILDTLASGNVVYSDAAIACGVRPNTFWHWIRASQLDRDPDLFVEYLGERMPFHHAVEAARQIALHDTRARTEKRSQNYLGEPVFFKGIPACAPVAEPEAAPVRRGDDIDLDEMLGPEPAPVVADVLPRRHGEGKTAEPVAEGHGRHHAQQAVPGHTAAPVADPVLIPNVVEHAARDDVPPAADEVPREDISDAIRQTPAPVAIDDTPNRPPRSALEADLFARLAAARARNAPGTTEGTGQPDGP